MTRNIKSKVLLSLIILLISSIIPVLAESNIKMLEHRVINDPYKVWKIKFNQDVMISSGESDDITIRDHEGDMLISNILSSSKDNIVEIMNEHEYEAGKTYYLCVGDKVKSTNNDLLNEYVVLPFSYEEKWDNTSNLKPTSKEVEFNYEGNVNEVSSFFPRWKKTIYSYMVDNKDGTLSVVEYNEFKKFISVETYNSEYELIHTKTIEPELPMFGGFYSGDTYNYIAFGQMNIEEDNNKEVIRIVKYDKNFKRVDSLSITGGECNTVVPFDAGSGRMAENGDTLVFHTSRERYASDDGFRHQSQLTLTIDTKTMKLENEVWDFQANHVSHSFDQYVLFDGEEQILIDHGDAYPRSIVLHKGSGHAYNSNDLFEIPGRVGANCTGVSIGGFEISSDNYIVAMNTIDHSLVTEYTSFEMVGLDLDQRDIILTVLPRNDINAQAKTITLGKYVGTDKIASIPQLVKLSDNRLLVMWQEFNADKIEKNHTMGDFVYVLVDENGKQIGETTKVKDLKLSECKPILFNDSVIWYTTENNSNTNEWTRTFHSVE